MGMSFVGVDLGGLKECAETERVWIWSGTTNVLQDWPLYPRARRLVSGVERVSCGQQRASAHCFALQI